MSILEELCPLQCRCQEAADEIAQLRAVLIKARDKLDAYYRHTGGEYPGGPLLSALNDQIEAALSHQQSTAGTR